MLKKILLIVAAVAVASCSSDKKETTPEKVEDTKKDTVDSQDNKNVSKTNMVIAGDLGEIDQAMVQKKFDEAKQTVQQCIIDGIGRDNFVGGSLNFTFRINLDGTVKKIDFQSTVGNRKIEKCIYDFAMKIKFVKPKGGEAKVDFPFSFESTMEIKKNWTLENLGRGGKKLFKSVIKCSDGTDNAPSKFKMVFYLLPDAEIGPMGISSDKKLVSDKFYNCVKKKLKKVKLPDPMGTVAKVILEVEP
ncbi:MAG: AgmX/PglI C-terminal domain-containing protein [Deltaproteobacteria bacterium]|nr:AgmX/PglI C-terminal domain-containing protein [Deltaproteobacteria bacterium]